MSEPGLGRRGVALVLFAGAVTMMARLWEGDLFRDEVLYAAVAKGIVASGDWLDLRLGDTPYWNKPPLMFWLAAASYRVLGVGVFAAKLFPALFGVLSCLVLFVLARRLVDERLALAAALVLATTPRFVRTSATFRLDSGVAFFTLLSLWLYVRGADAGVLGFVLAGAAWGLGVMAKGVFGLTGPYLFLIWCVVQRRPGLLVSPRFLISVLVGAALCVPWHLHEVARYGDPFLKTYFHTQVVDRFAGRLWHGPTASYLSVLVKDDWLWLPFLALGVVAAVRLARAGDRNVLYVLCWAGGYLGLLLLSQGRRARYLHQFYPPAAVLTALGLDRVLPDGWRARLPAVATRLFAALGLGLLLLPVHVHTHAATHLKALGPALEVLAPGDRSALTGFGTDSPNLRAGFLFYLDRDLRSVGRPDELDGARVVLAHRGDAGVLERRGFIRAYVNPEFALLRPPAR